MIRKRAIRFKVQPANIEAEAPGDFRQHQSSHAVASVCDNAEFLCNHAVSYAVDIRTDEIILGITAFLCGRRHTTLCYPVTEPRKPRIKPNGNSVISHDLAAVVVCRIMRCSDHNPAGSLRGNYRKIEQRRCRRADEYDICATIAQAADAFTCKAF